MWERAGLRQLRIHSSTGERSGWCAAQSARGASRDGGCVRTRARVCHSRLAGVNTSDARKKKKPLKEKKSYGV